MLFFVKIIARSKSYLLSIQTMDDITLLGWSGDDDFGKCCVCGTMAFSPLLGHPRKYKPDHIAFRQYMVCAHCASDGWWCEACDRRVSQDDPGNETKAPYMPDGGVFCTVRGGRCTHTPCLDEYYTEGGGDLDDTETCIACADCASGGCLSVVHTYRDGIYSFRTT